MRAVGKWLPLPLWVVVAMFVAGVGAGLGLSLMVTQGSAVPQQTAPWEDQQANVARTPSKPTEAADPAKPNGDAPAPAVVEPAPAAQQPAPIAAAKPVPADSDERWPAKMINSPVKRALVAALDALEGKQITCRKNENQLDRELVLRVGFESVGGMATVTELEAYAPNMAAFQGCMLRETSQMLIDFPVEDGFYQALWRLPAQADAKPEPTQKAAP